MQSKTGMFLLLVLAACPLGCQKPIPAEVPPRLFEGMGHYQRWITTPSDEAKAYFNQGLIWVYAFNYDEAVRSFREAARLDPRCTMAWWGVALASGPHINNPVMSAEQSSRAWDAIQKALALKNVGNYVEDQLVEALATRYAENPPADRKPLNEAYAAAMKGVYELDINDADNATLYAEALMNLQPWDLWDKSGAPKGNTNEILTVLERALLVNPNHPGANHLFIHALEASPHPEKADAAAQFLRDAVPASSHLMHMPSHIDVQLGRWAMASDQNEKAIQSEAKYRDLVPPRSFHNVYKAHNRHFLAFSAMMEGRSDLALASARKMMADVPAEFLRDEAPLIDPYMMIALDVLKRFGRWDEILREPAPPKQLLITTAMYHYARGLAFAAKGKIDRATREQGKFTEAVKKIPENALTGINPAHKVLSIASHMLTGEIALAEGKLDVAASEMRKAVEIEDDLLYMEPPEWIQPSRHTLAAVLVRARKYDEAERVYREDLAHWPENGWSLFGLAQCLKASGKTAEADEVQRRFEKAWARADLKITSSCLCVAD